MPPVCTLPIDEIRADPPQKRGFGWRMAGILAMVVMTCSASGQAIPQLREGDILLRRGRDWLSELIAGCNRTDRRFSHCGIVHFEKGQPYVYHFIDGSRHPSEPMHRDTPAAFLSARDNLRIGIARVSLSAAQSKTVSAALEKTAKSDCIYDNAMELSSDKKLYCTEFVHKLFRDLGFAWPVTQAGSKALVLPEDLYGTHAAALIWVKDL